MNALNNIQRVVSWNSKKNDDGTFTATTYSFDHNAPTVVHASYTRAPAAPKPSQTPRRPFVT